MIKLPAVPRISLYVAAGVIALLLVVWLGSKCTSDHSDYEKQRAAWEAERKQLQLQIRSGRQENATLLARIRDDSAQAAPIIREVDTLLITVERERAARIRVLNELARGQRALADTTEMSRIAAAAVTQAQAARQEADTLARAVTSLRGVVTRQMQNIAALTGNLQATQARADSCAALLDRAPVYKGDKLLGLIPLPSRTASFVIGGVLGAVTAVAVYAQAR